MVSGGDDRAGPSAAGRSRQVFAQGLSDDVGLGDAVVFGTLFEPVGGLVIDPSVDRR